VFYYIRRLIILAFIFGVAGLIVAQFMGPVQSNPRFNPAQAINAQMQVPTDVMSVFQRACRDCHSDTTDWPWYGAIAPGSWLMTADVFAGRSHMNLSEWGKYPPAKQYELLGHICKRVSNGTMPLWYYRYLHWPSAYLSKDDVNRICSWTKAAQARLKQQYQDLGEVRGEKDRD
jgi:hypothetical protein